MCGILGGVFRQSLPADAEDRFRKALGRIAHRGPDAEEVRVIPNANAVLAFKRLAIIDLATGDQPMATGSGHHIVFNGEIYNYGDLRPGLVAAGVPLRTRSDTEVLLWTLARQGTDGLQDMIGMFGFGFLDVPGRKLLLGRDRLGIKQVYYAHTKEGFFFASEPKALLALPWVRAEFDSARLPEYFTFRCAPAPNTLFRAVSKLSPGHVLRLSLDSFETTTTQYWKVPTPGDDHSDLGDSLDRFEAMFLDAVKQRLVSDVPVGAFLSGGLDSSLVVAGMRRLGHGDLRTFSATFPGFADDEAVFARRVSARFQTEHAEHAADPQEFLNSLSEWVELNDDLVADASSLPLLGVSRLARSRGCIVMLSGEGADELFAGYGSYHRFLALHGLHAALPTEQLRRQVASLAQGLGILHAQDRPRVAEYLVRGGRFMGTAALIAGPDLAAMLGTQPPPMKRADGPRLADLCAFDFRTRIPEDLLVRTDRATMGASIEARVPFLDHRVVELVFRLPGRHRALPFVTKLLPRLLAKRWGVPYQTIIHRKIGFHLPLGAWFRRELKPLWDTILLERLVPGIQYAEVGRIVEAHQRRAGHFEEILWRVAALELWYRRWILNQDAFRPRRSPDRATSLVAS